MAAQRRTPEVAGRIKLEGESQASSAWRRCCQDGTSPCVSGQHQNIIVPPTSAHKLVTGSRLRGPELSRSTGERLACARAARAWRYGVAGLHDSLS